MIKKTKHNSQKAFVNENAGDAHFKKGRFDKALKRYRKAVELGANNPRIYEKLVLSHKNSTSVWTEAEFAESLGWTMQKQELENPHLKMVHAKMEPEWNEIAMLIKEMMLASDDSNETALAERIAVYKDKATYPLVEALLSFKKLGKKRE